MSITEFSYGCPCEGCPKRIMPVLKKIPGVANVDVNKEEATVTLNGTFVPRRVIVDVWKKTGKTLEMKGENASRINEEAKFEIEAIKSAPNCGCFGF